MFFPIFIPRHDCDCEDRHGYDCECSKCKRKKELDEKPREYYERRYAIPKKAYRINLFFRVLSFLPFVIWSTAVVLMIWNISSLREYSVFPFIIVFGTIGGFVLAAIIFNQLDKLVKYEWDIKGVIRLEKVWLTDDTWKNILKKANVTKDKYHITKPKENWRYK